MTKAMMIEPVATDTLETVAAIAVFLGKTERQVISLLEKRELPAFQMNGRWHMRKSTYTAHLAQLEARAMSKARRAVAETPHQAAA